MMDVAGGASENVTLPPDAEYVFWFWYTPFIKMALGMEETGNTV